MTALTVSYHRKKWMGRIFTLIFAGAVVLIGSQYGAVPDTITRLQDDGNLHVVAFDIGQGDGILVRTSSGDDILIDGGPNYRIAEKLGAALPPSDQKIELMILTHPHADHVSGLVAVLERYEVEQVWISGAVHTSEIYLRFLSLLKEKSIPTKAVYAGEQFVFGDTIFTVIAPLEDVTGLRPQAAKSGTGGLNDTSVVVRTEFGETAVLFMGDASYELEKALISSTSTFRADVLKVGHHGSEYSTSRAFLDVIKPKIALISVGKNNRYDHPRERALKHLREAGTEIFRTDLNGDIHVICDREQCTAAGLKK